MLWGVETSPGRAEASNVATKERKIQVIMNGYRWIAAEFGGTITFSKDGVPIGKARWKEDQFLETTALLPDDVTVELEKRMKEALESDYFD